MHGAGKARSQNLCWMAVQRSDKKFIIVLFCMHSVWLNDKSLECVLNLTFKGSRKDITQWVMFSSDLKLS